VLRTWLKDYPAIFGIVVLPKQYWKVAKIAVRLFKWLLCVLVLLCVASCTATRPLVLPLERRPQWLQNEGIVMAGSWEPLPYRVRRDGGMDYTPTPQQRADYAEEHSPRMVAKLKEIGINFVMMHCYKGAGLEVERESMQDAVRFAKLCHDTGLHVGVYNYSGAFLWDSFFQEIPQAKDWLVLDSNLNPVTYSSIQKYRYYWDRNHPDAQEFYKGIIRFAIENIKADLLHWDNYHIGPGYDYNSIQRFRLYLNNTFTAAQLYQMGINDINNISPPLHDSNAMLKRAWQNFCCQSLADSYYDMSKYAKSIRNNILTECNPAGVGWRICPPIDHGRLLGGGNAYWSESGLPGYNNGELRTRIQDYKIGRRMNNMVFSYTSTSLACAEAMAFNLDCLGCVCTFEWGNIDTGKHRLRPSILPYIRFFHDRRDLLQNAEVIADVAVLRNFPSQVFGDANDAALTSEAEMMLIENRIPFQIIYDCHLNELYRYKVLVLAGCKAISEAHSELVKEYVRNGGMVCMVGETGTYDEWMRPRSKPAFADLPVDRVICIDRRDDILSAITKACNDRLSVAVKAPEGLYMEATRQKSRLLVHLVNYRTDKKARNIMVVVQLPSGYLVNTVRLASPQHEQEIDLEFNESDGKVMFTVPRVGIYEIAIINLKKA
jgi:hypothetical protein